MLVARPHGDITRFQTAIRPLLAGLASPLRDHASADGPATVDTRAAADRRPGAAGGA